MTLEKLVVLAARFVEAAGVLTIVGGGLIAAVLVYLQAGRDARAWYKLYRRYLGQAILLGLEFLVAADIIRTVSHIPTVTNVMVLGMIVLIRTFLSFTLQLEVEGRWPWQAKEPTAPARVAGS